MKKKHVEIAKDDLRGWVLPEALPAWERNGWTRVDDGSSESGDQPVADQANPTGDEPSVHEGGDQ